jgi:GTP-binding protein Era
LKGVILGKGGAKIKEIGSHARESLESFLDTRVFLELFVRVEADWDQNIDLIGEVLDEGLPS